LAAARLSKVYRRYRRLVLPLMFNSLLEASEIDPRNVRLLRHRDADAHNDFKPYELWRASYDAFMAHQSRQSARTEKIIGHAQFWASFVVTPKEETLFVGLYAVSSKRPGIFGAPGGLKQEKAESIVYELAERSELSELIAKLTIDWGGGFLPQVQRAETNDKQIIELRREFEEAQSPGYLSFMKHLSGIESLGAHPWTDVGRPAKTRTAGKSSPAVAPPPRLRAVS
jgi:hypothetical protein